MENYPAGHPHANTYKLVIVDVDVDEPPIEMDDSKEITDYALELANDVEVHVNHR